MTGEIQGEEIRKVKEGGRAKKIGGGIAEQRRKDDRETGKGGGEGRKK